MVSSPYGHAGGPARRRSAPGPAGPGHAGRRRAPKAPLWARLFVWFGAIVLVLSAGSVAGAEALIARYEGSVHKANWLGTGHGRDVISGQFNYLLLGSDVRAGDTSGNKGRSDTIMIFHVAQDHRSAYLISIPRDLWVHINQCSANAGDGGCMSKINAAYDFGGPKATAETVQSVTGAQLDGVAMINFYSFDKIVDALGGVDMCVDQPVTSHQNGTVYQPGCRHFDGSTALDYVRQRYGLAQGDFDRQKHQQQLVKAAVTQAKKENLVTNPGKLDKIIKLAGNDLTVDSHGVALSDLAYSLRNIGSGDITMLRLPEIDAENDNGESIQQLDDRGKSLFAALTSDTLDQWALQHPDLVNHDAM